MTLAAHNETDRVEQLILLTKRLTKLLDQETALFIARKPHESAEISKEKMQLATLYRLECQKIAAHPELIAAAPAQLRDELRALSVVFEASLERNGNAIVATKDVTEGLVRAIGQEVAKLRGQTGGYGANAKLPDNSAAIGVTLDKRA